MIVLIRPPTPRNLGIQQTVSWMAVNASENTHSTHEQAAMACTPVSCRLLGKRSSGLTQLAWVALCGCIQVALGAAQQCPADGQDFSSGMCKCDGNGTCFVFI